MVMDMLYVLVGRLALPLLFFGAGKRNKQAKPAEPRRTEGGWCTCPTRTDGLGRPRPLVLPPQPAQQTQHGCVGESRPSVVRSDGWRGRAAPATTRDGTNRRPRRRRRRRRRGLEGGGNSETSSLPPFLLCVCGWLDSESRRPPSPLPRPRLPLPPPASSPSPYILSLPPRPLPTYPPPTRCCCFLLLASLAAARLTRDSAHGAAGLGSIRGPSPPRPPILPPPTRPRRRLSFCSTCLIRPHQHVLAE